MTGGDSAHLRRLLPHLREHRRIFAAAMGANLAAQLAAVGAAVCTAWLAGRAGLEPAVPITDGPGTWVLAALGLCVVTVAVATWGEMLAAHDLAYRVLATLRVRLFDRLRRTLPSRSEGRRSGDLSSAALADIESLEWIYAHVFAQVVGAAAVVVAGTVGLAVLYPPVLLVLLPAVAVIVSVPWWMRRAGDRHGVQLRDQAASLSADVVDLVQGISELAAAGALDRWRTALARRTTELNRLGVRAAARGGIEAAAIDALISLAALGCLALTVVGIRDAGVALPAAPVVLALSGAVLAPAAMVAGTLKEAGSLRAAATRIFTLMESPDPAPEPDRPTDVDHDPRTPLVRFDDVVFGYDPARPVLRGLTFSIARGEVVALVGASGAGKSTATALLHRFWDVDSGSVRVAGTDVRDLSDTRLRELVTAVPQEIHLFAGTVADNLALGRASADPEEVAWACGIAQLTPVLDRLPGGTRTTIGERGARLSGGERTRVAIARALLVGAPVLVLDEAVANLDATNERQLHDAMAVGAADRATLVVAHRASTILRADRVVVLDGGRIVEQGDPAELLAGSSALSRLLRGTGNPSAPQQQLVEQAGRTS